MINAPNQLLKGLICTKQNVRDEYHTLRYLRDENTFSLKFVVMLGKEDL
jgi:hypothetical protein